jgi:hypothetical protein
MDEPESEGGMTKAAIKQARREAAELRRRKLELDACAFCGDDQVVEAVMFDGWGPEQLGLCDGCMDDPGGDGEPLERVRLELWEAMAWKDPMQKALLEEHRRRQAAEAESHIAPPPGQGSADRH